MAERSPVVRAWLCPPCGGYEPLSTPAGTYQPGRCDGPCQAYSRELHRFQALILSGRGCACGHYHWPVTGDLPTEQSARQVMTEVRTRPPQPRSDHG